MDTIDKLTLELMMNKTHYQKYLSKTDPVRYQENQEHVRKIRKYRYRILELTTELLDNYVDSRPVDKHNSEVNSACDEYIRTCMQYFEMRDLEIHGDSRSGAAVDDDDVLFDENKMNEPLADTLTDTIADSLNETEDLPSNNKSSSFWGKSVKRENKPTAYTMDMYMKPKSKK